MTGESQTVTTGQFALVEGLTLQEVSTESQDSWWCAISLASQTFARKTGGSGDISIAVAVPVERTECNFCCVAVL